MEAAVNWLRADPIVRAAFGDTWVFDFPGSTTGTGTCKFWADFAIDEVLPYLVFHETGGTYDYQSPQRGNVRAYIATAQFLVAIRSTGRFAARQLGKLVAKSLDDADLDWAGGSLMMIRLSSDQFVQVPTAGPGVPAEFQFVLSFSYQYSGAL